MVDISHGEGDYVTKPLSRQTSVQSTKSINSNKEVSENQTSINSPIESGTNRTLSIKRNSTISQSSNSGNSEQESLINHSEINELLSEPYEFFH